MNKQKSTRLLDALVIIASLLIIGVSVAWTIHSGILSFNLTADERLSWHLVRSAGIVAYGLLLVSTVWGLFMSGQFVKNWSPGAVSMIMHATISWLAVIVGLIHALLLLLDKYYTYTLADIFIPFTGPYRPEVVGLGILAFWMILLVTLTFSIKKRIGHKWWKLIHYLSYVSFGMVTLHGMFAGTDGERFGFRVLVALGVLLVVALLTVRVSRAGRVKPAPTVRRV